ncbi:molybdenum cofactor biosynthesis protein MoeB, partial [Salmonella enterica subsp. enterica serovar Java]|nr:molybdenum cofactor biosynthesis protein MoeB [Salmonella enterica subsp. enterica serovar Java]
MDDKIIDYNRYSRQILMPEIGVSGQIKLLESKVLIVGCGGLGAPVSLYLTAAGIGTIGLVEYDTVDKSNLQRQILYA